MMSSPFHEGERHVQERVGVATNAARIGRMIRPAIPAEIAEFLRRQSFVIVASADAESNLWASILVGPPGFAEATDPHTLRLDAQPPVGDPLCANLQTPRQIGLLGIEFATRKRVRLNGTATLVDGGLTIQAEEVYGNCPKYIQQRDFVVTEAFAETTEVVQHPELSAAQRHWITSADTFIVASAHPTRGADASHRGGNPRFVRVEENQLTWPDYAGNMMFNTLGNIAINPNVGLLFIDFEQGNVLQLTGQARIVWDTEQIQAFAGAERLVTFEVEKAIEHRQALPSSSADVVYSPFNPN